MNLARIFLFFVISFSVGVFTASFLSLSYFFGLFFIFLGAISFLFGKRFFIFCLIIIAFGAGIFWYEIKSIPPDISFLENQINEKVNLRGIIIDEPDERENYTRLILEAEGVKILVTSYHYPSFKYGDEIEVKGTLKRPGKFDEFDWGAYLAKDDIYFEMFYPETKFISSGNASWIKASFFSLKNKFLSNVARVVPEPHSALLGGLTFGAKQSMPKDLLDDFRKTGIIHIVVLSGYNVTIIADAIMRVLGFLPHFLGIGFGALGIVCFAVMAGASATVVRASLMALLVLLARATGRIYEITIALFATGFLMILQNPKILRFDSSFQLSFLATMALVYLAPILEPRLKIFPKKFQIRQLASATLSTQIFVLPLILYKMGLFSVVGLPVNLLVLMFIPATMFFGFVTAVVGFASTLLSVPFGWITYGLLAYQLKVVELFSSLPFASFTIENFPLWLMLTMYAFYAIIIFRLRKNL
ncbi:ComEC family competence protein [Patescibacteria group bacterium]|nr:ComEC family competence protein [Patescibacteria group bacterium]MBU2633552.1 ComEC family competence protein [Patescibacteria group bacterium]